MTNKKKFNALHNSINKHSEMESYKKQTLENTGLPQDASYLSINFYEKALGFCENWIMLFDKDGKVEYTSKSIEKATGYEVKEFIENPNLFLEIILENDIKKFHVSLKLADGIKHEFRIQDKNGVVRWICQSVNVYYGTNGEQIGLLANVTDISEDKARETEPMIIENNYRMAFNSGNCFKTISLSETGEVLDLNQAFVDLFGNLKFDIFGREYGDVFFYSKKDKLTIFNQLELQGKIRNMKIIFKKKNKTKIITSLSVEQRKFGDKKYLFTEGYDLSPLIKKDILIENQKQNFECIFNNAEVYFFIIDKKNILIEMNPFLLKKLGFERNEIIGKSISYFFSKEKKGEYSTILTELWAGSKKHEKIEISTKSSLPITLEILALIGKWKGKTSLFFTAKEGSLLKPSEEKFMNDFFLNPSSCMITEPETWKIIEVNDAFCELLGYSRDEIIGKTINNFDTSGMLKMNQFDPNKHDTTNHNNDLMLVTCNGDVKHVILNSEIIKQSDTCFRLTVINDITGRKMMKEAIKYSEESYKILSDAAFEAIILSRNGFCFDQNIAAEKMLGYRKEEILGKSIFDLIKTEKQSDHNWFEPSIKEPFQLKIQRKDGSFFYSLTQIRIIHSLNVDTIVIAVRDITDFYLLKQSMIKAEGLFTRVAEHTKTFTWEINQEGLFTYISPMVEKVLGYKSSEIIGKLHFYDLHPPKSRENFKIFVFSLLEKKKPFYEIENVLLSKNGHINWFSTNGIPLFDSQGKWVGYEGSNTNINQKKLQQKRIKNKIKEIEGYQKQLIKLNNYLMETEENVRTRLAGFLHNEIGQLLSIMNLQITSLIGKGHLTNETDTILQKTSLTMQKAITLCRTETYELSHIILKEQGLINALKWKLGEMKEIQPMESFLSFDQSIENINEKLKILLYRIIVELINNVLKHAQASEITISIQQAGNELVIEVVDNGKGFENEPRKSIFRNQSFGLFNIRERLKPLGGELIVKSIQNEGTRVLCKVPFSK